MNRNYRTIFILLVAVCIFASNIPARADGPTNPQPAVDPNSSWGQVVDSNGNIQYSNLTDGGVVQQQANWMPSILGVSMPATYHVYYTQSGDTIVMPSAITLMAMAADPQESGFSAAASSMGTSGVADMTSQNNGGMNVVGLAAVGTLIGALEGNVSIGAPTTSAATNFFQQIAAGATDLSQLAPNGWTNFLQSISQNDTTDGAIYTYMLMYTSDQCSGVPGGCTAQNLPPAPPPAATNPPPANCPGPSVHPGAISDGGSKTYPPYPLVVGQDPNKTGVDLAFHASVAPTIYIYYVQVPIRSCASGPDSGGGYNCGGGSGHMVTTGFRCVQQSRSYNECIASASGSISLTSASRAWILNTLSLQYPETYIHKPFFGFGGSGCAWSASGKSVQIDDPGTWDIAISGRTSGTPVSGPRGFSGGGSPFDVWLKEVEIIK